MIIYTLNGKKVREWQIQATNNTFRINFSNGEYIFVYQFPEYVASEKISIVK